MLGDADLKKCAAIATAIAHAKNAPMATVTLALALAMNRASFARASQDCQMWCHARLVKEIVNALMTKVSILSSCYSAWSIARI